MSSWEAVIDAAATLPFFVDVLLPFVEVPPLSWLRIFRVARIFHSSQHATAVRTAGRILYVNREILLVALTLVSFMVFATSALLQATRAILAAAELAAYGSMRPPARARRPSGVQSRGWSAWARPIV